MQAPLAMNQLLLVLLQNFHVFLMLRDMCNIDYRALRDSAYCDVTILLEQGSWGQKGGGGCEGQGHTNFIISLGELT